MQKFASAFLLGSVLLLGAAPLCLAQSMPGAGHNRQVSIVLGDDKYVSGGVVSVVQATTGDLVVAGGQVHVHAAVGKEILAAGGDVNLDQVTVGDDVRVAAATINISGTMKGDVMVAGGTVTISKNTVINGDLSIFGGTIMMSGTVKGTLHIKGGEVTVDGIVAGPADVTAKTLTINGATGPDSKFSGDDLQFGGAASLKGTTHYWTQSGRLAGVPAAAVFDPSLRQTHVSPSRPAVAGIAAIIFGILSIFSILSSAVLIIVLLLLAESFFGAAAVRAQEQPWLSILYGFLYMIAAPVLAFLLLLTIIGIPLALFVGFLYAFSLFFSTVLTAMVLAKVTQNYFKKKWNRWMYFFISLLFAVGLKILWIIPFIGWILHLGLVLLAFGALLRALRTPKAKPVAKSKR